MESLKTTPNINTQPAKTNKSILLPSLASLLLLSFSAPSLAGWEIKWIDTFEGNAVNWDNWNAQTEANYNNEVQCYTDDDSSTEKNYDVSDGTLKIIARKKANNCPTLNNQYKTWTSGRLNSKDKQEFLYGRVESRIRFHNLEGGTWPAFWMLENRIQEQPYKNDDDFSHWPNAGAGEIDVWEWFSNEPDTYITNFFNEQKYISSDCGNEVRYSYPNGASDVTNWHNYAMEWTADKISFYIDNTLVISQDVSNCSQYKEPMFVLLNLAMGGALGGNIDANLQQATLEIDYVAHCQASETNSARYCNEELIEQDYGELKVSINVSQKGADVVEINPANGPVTLSANLSNAITDNSYSYDWDIDRLPSAITIGNRVIFDPVSLEDGNYYVSVKLTDQQDPDYNDSDALTLKVKALTPVSIASENSSGGSINEFILALLSMLFLIRRHHI